MNPSKNMTFQLGIGVKHDGKILKSGTLLRANGLAERVYADKSIGPNEWSAKVLAISIAEIGGVPIAAQCRKDLLENDSFIVPQIVYDIPLVEVNSLLLEIHRKCWKPILYDQLVICNLCGKDFKEDLNLNKMGYEDAALKQLEFGDKESHDWFTLTANLLEGFTIEQKGSLFAEDFVGRTVTSMTFDLPLLSHSIAHQDVQASEVLYWRKIAFDCWNGGLLDNGVPIPLVELKSAYGMRLFDLMLDSVDLDVIRKALRDYTPTPVFEYMAECVCPKKKMVPMTMGVSSFFEI
jgi:hypothetical protein